MWAAAFKFTNEFLERVEDSEVNSAGQWVVDVADAGRQIALMVITSAGFGVKLAWPASVDQPRASARLDLIESLRGTLKLLIVKVLMPAVSHPHTSGSCASTAFTHHLNWPAVVLEAAAPARAPSERHL
jgi:hypothetical protein